MFHLFHDWHYVGIGSQDNKCYKVYVCPICRGVKKKRTNEVECLSVDEIVSNFFLDMIYSVVLTSKNKK